MSTLAAAIEGLALLGPGLPDWESTRAVLRGERPYVHAPTAVPVPALLPPNERRRSGLAVKIALAVGAAALAQGARDASRVDTVFASSSADGDTCHAICEQLAGADRLISPTRFHNSVHNAPSGYWSIATRCMAPSTSLCGYDASFGAGLLEACAFLHAHGRPVLLVAYDAPYPEPLLAKRPVRDVCRTFGIPPGKPTTNGGAEILDAVIRTNRTGSASPLSSSPRISAWRSPGRNNARTTDPGRWRCGWSASTV